MKLRYISFTCKDCNQPFALISTVNRTLCPECHGRRIKYGRLQRKIPFGLTPPEWKKGKNKQQLVDYTPPANRRAVIKRKGPAI